eukprot:2242380-Pyramimonas_sp.AAC.1
MLRGLAKTRRDAKMLSGRRVPPCAPSRISCSTRARPSASKRVDTRDAETHMYPYPYRSRVFRAGVRAFSTRPARACRSLMVAQ